MAAICLCHNMLSMLRYYAGCAVISVTSLIFYCFVVMVLHLHVHHFIITLWWRHNGRDNVSNHQLHDCLLTRLFRCRSKKTSKLRITGLCAGTSAGMGEFPAKMASDAENVSIWWRHHEFLCCNMVSMWSLLSAHEVIQISYFILVTIFSLIIYI